MRIAIIVVAAVLVLGAGTYGLLIATGQIKLGSQVPKVVIKPLSKTERMVPITFKELPAGTKIGQEVLVNPKTGQVVAKRVDLKPFLDSGKAPPYFVGAEQFMGRVLKHDKHPGYPFSEGDFYPEHTGEGAWSGIPEGMRGITFDPKKLIGCRSLKFNDHIDLMAGEKFDFHKEAGGNPDRRSFGDSLTFKISTGLVGVVARDAVVVTPVSTVLMVTGSSATGKLKTKPSEQIVIAVKVEDTPAVISLFESGAYIFCLPHSARPEKEHKEIEVTSIAATTANMHNEPVEVEEIHGKHHSHTIVHAQTQPGQAEMNAPWLVPVALPNKLPAPTTAPAHDDGPPLNFQ